MDTASHQFVSTVTMRLDEYKELQASFEDCREEAEYLNGKIALLTQDVYELELELEALKNV